MVVQETKGQKQTRRRKGNGFTPMGFRKSLEREGVASRNGRPGQKRGEFLKKRDQVWQKSTM